MKKIPALFLVMQLCLLVPFYPAQAAGVVSLRDAYAYVTLKGTENGAAFVTFENHSDAPAFIKSVSSDIAKKTEIHDHQQDENGIMSMVKLDEVRVPPHSVIQFAPGGLHVMLINLNKPLNAGEMFELRFTLEDGRTLPFNVTVKERDK